MKAKDWTFEGLLPDQEDLEAESNARQDFWAKNEHLLCAKTPAAQNHTHIFVAAFNRGMAWALAKHNLPEQRPPSREPEVGDPGVRYGVAMQGSKGNYGYLAGPYRTEKEALDYKPTESGTIFLVRMETSGQDIPTETPLYRWHPTLEKWIPKRQEMRRTT